MQTITRFESLPNEVLIQSCQYLDAIDIFHSFDYLNWRFSALIRNISLCLDLGRVEKSKLTQFGIKLLLNPEMKNQIMSIILKKNDMLDNLEMLFSFVSPNEFTQLEALIFAKVNSTSIDQISSILPSLPNLRYVSMDNSFDWSRQILRSLSQTTVKTLTIQTIPNEAFFRQPPIPITHLTIDSCSVKDLCRFFKYSPVLQNVNIQRLRSYDIPSAKQSPAPYVSGIYIERLVVHEYSGQFDALEVLLQHTPNLKYFFLHSDGDSDVADANRWCKLIKNTLPHLDIFKFLFHFDVEDVDHGVTDKFRPFQTTFWRDQHKWYTEYTVNNAEALIYTVPYILHRYEIKSNSNRYYSHPINTTDIFRKVTDLTVNILAMNVIDQYYFPHVQSLILNNECVEENHDYAYMKHKHISALKSMVNLCHITHLEITRKLRWKSSSIIWHLMNETNHLSSFKTNKTTLLKLMKNSELCERLKMIKKLDIGEFWLSAELGAEEIKQICEVFSKMAEFRCRIEQLDILQTVIDYLSRSSFKGVFSYTTSNSRLGNIWLKEHQSELKLYSFTISCEYCGIDFDDDDDDDYDYHHDYYGYDDDDDDFDMIG